MVLGRLIIRCHGGCERPKLFSWALHIVMQKRNYDHTWPLAMSDFHHDFDTWEVDLRLCLFWLWAVIEFIWIKKAHPSIYADSPAAKEVKPIWP